MGTNEKYDLVIIGGGPGGYVAAIRAAQLGLKTACLEKEPALGGTCLRIGCIPSKALLESSELFSQAKSHLAQHGIGVGNVQLDLAAMLKRKDDIVKTLARGIDNLFEKNKITRWQGHGRLIGSGRVSVLTSQKETLEITATHIILATGSKVAPLPGVELDGDLIGTSTEALSYPNVPGHLVVIGAGAIGLELGSVWNRLGARVTVLEYLDRILPGIDAEIAAGAMKIFKKQGLNFKLKMRVTRAHLLKQQCFVECEGAEPVAGDRVLLAVGRKPNTDDLGLESVGIVLDQRGFIPVGEHFATTAAGIYAVGDCIGGPMLAHKAEEEGVACVEHLATGFGHVAYDTIPNVVYTNPEIAGVGKTEESLKEAGIAYRKGVFPFMANGRARTLGATEGQVKILSDAKTDRLLGAHLIGPHAGEIIAEVAVAMEFGASSEDLARCVHAHPSLAEAIKEAALAVDKRAIHI